MRVRVLQDVARLCFLVLVTAPAIVVADRVPMLGGRVSGTTLQLGSALVTHLLCVGVLRRLIPRPMTGDHRVLAYGPYLGQAISRAFVEIAGLPVFRGPLWLFHWGRVAHLDLLGAKMAWDVGLPYEFSVRDPALLTIERGTVLEPGVVIEASTLRAGRAHVGAVSIGQRCVIGAQVFLLPGVQIAHDVRVEPGALLADDVRVGVSAVIGPGARLAPGVTVGAQASIGAGAVLAEGVTLGERARVAAGAFVPAGTQIADHARFPRPSRPVASA